MKAPWKQVRIRFDIDRASAQRAVVVGGSLVLFAIAGAAMAVPVTFTDGNVLTAQQLNDNFANLEQRLVVAEGRGGDSTGTRLKGKYLLGSDGSREYVKGVWYDSQRQENCTYELLTDGKKHCLSEGYVEGYYFYYLDALCTRLVVLIPPTTPGCVPPPIPTYQRVTEPQSACGSPDGPAMTLHQLVGPVSLPSQVYDKGGPTGCQGTAKGVPSTWQAYEYGPEIAPSNFVEATTAVDP